MKARASNHDRRGLLLGLLALGMFSVATFSRPAEAAVPPGKLVMLDVDKLKLVSSKYAPNNSYLSFREVIEAGVNGVHFRHWTGTGSAYTQESWVQEAKEWGLWVAGGTSVNTNVSVSECASQAADLASWGVDFIQLDEPMGFGLTEADYLQIKQSAKSVNPACPTLITDVFYNDTIASWSSVNGLVQEVYCDLWYPNIDQAVAYKNAHPGQDVMMWVWLPEHQFYPDECTPLPDSKFDLWFGDSFDRIGQTLLFIYQSRETTDPCAYGANWAARAQTIAAKTAGYRAALPTWENFVVEGASDGSPNCAVQVRSEVGLSPQSIKVYYTTDDDPEGGTHWTEWTSVDWTGTEGTKDWVTITAHDVPFNQVSSTLNKVKFKITDTYAGSYYRGPRTDQMDFLVEITETDGGAGGASGAGGGSTGGTGGSGGSTGGTGGSGSPGGFAGTGGTGGGSASGGGSYAVGNDEADGCACSAFGNRGTAPGGAGALMLLGVVLGARRRRFLATFAATG